MTDIFHEVEEEVRRERFEKIWKKYGDYAIAAVAVDRHRDRGLQVVAALRNAAAHERVERT